MMWYVVRNKGSNGWGVGEFRAQYDYDGSLRAAYRNDVQHPHYAVYAEYPKRDQAEKRAAQLN